jgi:hypothetical protein
MISSNARRGLTSVSRLNALVVLLGILAAGQAYGGLVITPVYDSSITSDPQAATIKATINSVIQIYEKTFSDPITVTITFQETSTGLGQSSSYYNTGFPYSTFRAALAADASTHYDAIALANLPAGVKNPVNGSGTIELTLPNGRALGFSGIAGGYDWNPPPGETDAVVYLNTSLMNLSRTTIDPNKYDLVAVVEHEINEVLGLSSALDGATAGSAPPTGDVDVLDLYRFDQSGGRSFNTLLASQAYFSIDGTTRLVRFNQADSGDFHDWYSPGTQTPRVQDAFATLAATPNMSVELIALDVIGYNYQIPTLSIAPAGAGQARISWSPNTPGFVLQECFSLSSPVWVNSASGTNNPVTLADPAGVKFYRLFHP